MTITALANYKVHPVGFTTFEQSTIETFFRLAARKAPFWSVCAELEDAAVILLNASERQDIEAFKSRGVEYRTLAGRKIVIVGASDLGTGWPVLNRPLRLTSMLTTLNDLIPRVATAPAPSTPQSPNALRPTEPPLLHQRTIPAPLMPLMPLMPLTPSTPSLPSFSSSPVAPFVPRPSQIVGKPVAPNRASALWPLHDVFATPKPPSAPPAAPSIASTVAPTSAPSAATQNATFSAPPSRVAAALAPVGTPSRFGGAPAAAAAAPQPSARKVLIVDDSDVALKFMQSRMRIFGFDSQLARSGEEALALIAQHAFEFVFLDVMMAGLDGYQTCRAIKQNKVKQAAVPVVVMLTSRGGTIDKIRGSMSGCDAYLTKPLNEQQLGLVLAKHGAGTIKKGLQVESAPRQGTSSYTSRNTGRTH